MNNPNNTYFKHATAIVDEPNIIGVGTKIWHFAHIRENVHIGQHTIIAKGVYLDHGVSVGSYCKIQNNVSIYAGVTVGDGVFIGPHVCFTNDLFPRACGADGAPLEWEIVPTLVHNNVSIGANATIICGVSLAPYCLIGAGSVVTKDIPAHALAFGNPCQIVGIVSRSGYKVSDRYEPGRYSCPKTGETFDIT